MPVHVFPDPPRAVHTYSRSPAKKTAPSSPVNRENHSRASGSSSSPLSSLDAGESSNKGTTASMDAIPAGDDPLLLTSSAIMEPEQEEDDVSVDHDDADMEDDSDSDVDGQAEDNRIVVNVEVLLRSDRHVGRQAQTLAQVRGWLLENESELVTEEDLNDAWQAVHALADRVERIRIAESVPKRDVVDITDAVLHIHCYTVDKIEELESFTTTLDDDEDDQQVPAATIRSLPSAEIDGLWDNLIYSNNLKSRLLQYIRATIHFSTMEIDPDLVSWNRLVLLHGPPGTGKTSLCRALAQKLCIRMANTFPSGGKLVEINSHSLFSKWYSESGKLVQKLFSQVTEMAADEGQFIVIMIDEVESLTAARTAAMRGNEPGDAVRVVNALLTQLDKLKTRKNVLVLTTSNITEAIDPAFIDRADIKEFVDFPPAEAIYWILTTSLKQLMAKGMIRRSEIPAWRSGPSIGLAIGPNASQQRNGHAAGSSTKSRRRAERQAQVGQQLRDLAYTCSKHTLAGRFLRRLPLLAYSGYLLPQSGGADEESLERSLADWVAAMAQATDAEIESRRKMGLKSD